MYESTRKRERTAIRKMIQKRARADKVQEEEEK